MVRGKDLNVKMIGTAIPKFYCRKRTNPKYLDSNPKYLIRHGRLKFLSPNKFFLSMYLSSLLKIAQRATTHYLSRMSHTIRCAINT